MRPRHPLAGRLLPAFLSRADERGAREHRKCLLSCLAGRVIEVGAGHGPNFPWYPRDVTEVVAVEPEPYLRQRARKAAPSGAVPIRVVDGVAERLPFPDRTFDAGVASLLLCSVRDPALALREFARVIRPGGVLAFYEHVRSTDGRLALLQRALDATLWPLVSGGCHCSRDLLPLMEACGFRVEDVRHILFRPSALFLHLGPYLLGRARRVGPS